MTAHRLAAIAELAGRRCGAELAASREQWACDGWDNAAAELAAALSIGHRAAGTQMLQALRATRPAAPHRRAARRRDDHRAPPRTPWGGAPCWWRTRRRWPASTPNWPPPRPGSRRSGRPDSRPPSTPSSCSTTRARCAASTPRPADATSPRGTPRTPPAPPRSGGGCTPPTPNCSNGAWTRWPARCAPPIPAPWANAAPTRWASSAAGGDRGACPAVETGLPGRRTRRPRRSEIVIHVLTDMNPRRGGRANAHRRRLGTHRHRRPATSRHLPGHHCGDRRRRRGPGPAGGRTPPHGCGPCDPCPTLRHSARSPATGRRPGWNASSAAVI